MSELDALRERIRETKTKSVKKRPPKWKPVTEIELSPLRVLAFDQTLSNTGWAVVGYDRKTGIEVIAGGIISPSKDARGSFWETYEKSIQLSIGVRKVFDEVADDVDFVCFETPPVGQAFRPESSLIAGQVVYAAARKADLPIVMVGNQRMRAKLIPPEHRGERTKRSVKDAVEAIIPPKNRQLDRWNEHIIDAVGLGVCSLIPKEDKS